MATNKSEFAKIFPDLLHCPADGSLLTTDLRNGDGGEQTMTCPSCSRSYPIVRGIPRFVGSDQYAENFSYEWRVHRHTQLDTKLRTDSEDTFREKTGWIPDDIRGKRVLDVGCGMGRFADVVVRWGGEVVGVDLSFAVESAQANLAAHSRFRAVQASVFELPFADESFDAIYSLGVLHHTPDCERAFKCLPRLLRPGGRIAIWVYSTHSYPWAGLEERRDRIYRRYTTTFPSKLLHAFCRVICRVPLRPRALWHMLRPGFVFHAIPRLHHNYRNYDWRVLDTFDWYSPTYQSKHSYAEVCKWFREALLTDIIPLPPEVAVQGRKPSSAAGAPELRESKCVESSE